MNDDILAAHNWPTNGHLIADVARLGYLTDDMVTLDATLGRGVFWCQWRPTQLVTMGYTEDDDAALADTIGDFRHLPFRTASFDAVIYDPPYMCVSTDTEILTDRGWLRHDEVKVGDQAWTLDHENNRAEWQPIQEIHLYPAKRRQMMSLRARDHSSLSTMEHRWPVERRCKDGRSKREWTTSAELRASHYVPIAAPPSGLPTSPTHSDAFVELVAWFWTEGTMEKGGTYGNITQSHVVNSNKCDMIRAAFAAEYGPDHGPFPRVGRQTDGVPRWREAVDGHKRVWWFSADLGRQFQAVAPGMVPTMEFLRSLTAPQLDLFIARSVDGDGCRAGDKIRLGQGNWERAEAFQVAATIAGYATSIRTQKSGETLVTLRVRRNFKPWRNNPTVVEHNGPVWCVTTANGTWMARRDGTSYFTGNSKGTPQAFAEMDKRYGVGSKGKVEIWDLMAGGLDEVVRVCRPDGRIITKAGRGIDGGKLWRGDDRLVEYGESLGMTVITQFRLLTRPRSQKHRGPQKTPRSNYSTLTVWDAPPAPQAQTGLF